MSAFETKKQVVSQVNNPATANVVAPGGGAGPNPGTSITTPKINQYTAPANGLNPPPGAPGAMTGRNAVQPNANAGIAPASAGPQPQARGILDDFQGILDGQQNANKDYLDKWQEMNNDRLDREYDDAKNQLEGSKNDLDKWYNGGKEELGDTLYNQQEQTNADATSRGISYSPQALGLQGVHNINYNKNLTKLMEQKTSLLNDINLKISSLKTQYDGNKNDIALGALDKQFTFNNNYNDKILELLMTQNNRDYDKYLTDDERKYGESQTEKDKLWQKEWYNYQNTDDRAWQKEWLKYQMEMEKKFADENKGRGYSGGRSGYSSNYTPYESNFTPYARGNRSGGSDVNFDAVATIGAGMESAKQYSSDVYNDLSYNSSLMTLDNIGDYTGAYDSYMNPLFDSLNGADPKYREELDKTAQTARMFMERQASANSTNTPWKNSDGHYTQPIIPWSKNTLEKNKAKASIKEDIAKGNNFKAKTTSNAYGIHEKIMSGAGKSKVEKPKTAVKATKTNKVNPTDFAKKAKTGTATPKKTNNTIKKAVSKVKPTDFAKNAKTGTAPKKTTAKKAPAKKAPAKKGGSLKDAIAKNIRANQGTKAPAKKAPVKKKTTVKKSLQNLKKNIGKFFGKK